MGKRANGEGSVRQRANGRWEGRLQFDDPATGQTVRRSVYGATAREVRSKLREMRERVDEGQPARDASTSVAEWMVRWLTTTLAASDRKESTKALYRTLSAKHIEGGVIGTRRLDRLRPSDVEALVLAMKGAMRDDGSRMYADSTIRSVFTVLRQALDGAVRDGLLARNPAAVVRRPGVERTEARFRAADDLRALLRATDASRYGRAVRLIALTGMRRGEALALRWDDVDFDAGTVRVRGTLARVGRALSVTEPKTERSRRVIPLSDAAARVFREQRLAQLEERVAAANVWTDTGFVFRTEAGSPVDRATSCGW